jgi:pyrroline-5-carboxylate reductase
MSLDDVTRRGMVLLGCGKMGGAMLEGWLGRGVPASAIHVIDPAPSDWLKGTGVHLGSPLPERPAVLLLAVKPQAMDDALPQVARLGGPETLAISIAAGLPIARFEAALPAGTPIVRAMPNLPASVGRGITALVASPAAGEEALLLAEALLSAVGTTVRLQDEDQMDAVTAVSGSGPGYVFHMVEALAQAGEAQGLAPDLAMALARATVAGAGALLDSSEGSAAELRMSVTSQKGTTAAGLAVLMADLPELMRRAVAAAADRARELGQ